MIPRFSHVVNKLVFKQFIVIDRILNKGFCSNKT